MKLFRPTFCCCCGEKIDRIEWRLWTSRKFCEVCESIHKGDELFPRIVVAAALLFGLFGFGSFLNSGSNTSAIDRPESSASTVSVKPRYTLAATSADGANAKPAAEPVLSDAEQNATAAKTVAEPVVEMPDPQSGQTFFCGARTKKGTPCSRRVKEKGRCWQHRGMPEMKKFPANGKYEEEIEEF